MASCNTPNHNEPSPERRKPPPLALHFTTPDLYEHKTVANPHTKAVYFDQKQTELNGREFQTIPLLALRPPINCPALPRGWAGALFKTLEVPLVQNRKCGLVESASLQGPDPSLSLPVRGFHTGLPTSCGRGGSKARAAEKKD